MSNPIPESLLRQAAAGLNADPETLERAVEKGDAQALLNALNPAELQKVQAVLQDPEAMKKIMNSPLAKGIRSEK